MRKLRVLPKNIGQRVDVFVTSRLPNFTRSALKGLFKRGQVLVNDRPIKAGHKLRPQDTLIVDTSLLDSEPAPVKLPVVYEDKDAVVINKPAGILTHSKGGLTLEPTVASFIKGKLTDKSLSGNRAGIVHRLDRGTSGVIIGAKTAAVLAYLQKQFSTRQVKKAYVAVVEGQLEPAAALIDAPIARHPKKPQTFRVSAAGKPAQTEYHLLKSFKRGGLDFSYVELKPLTGRTHQLRVHLKYVGHPVVGDPVYGRSAGPLLLHAKSLTVSLPSGETKTFSAPLPKIFKEFMDHG